jgi:hypothetical protein
MVEQTPNGGQSASRLPANPSSEFLRKLAKDRVRQMRTVSPEARLYEAQLSVAREHGFGSWRELAAHLSGDRRGTVHKTGDRVFIEGIEPLSWWGSNCTYLAAMANALRVIGPAHDQVRLYGDSSLAFRLRFWANDACTASCPSGPGGEFRPWTDITERSTGWTTRWDLRLSGEREAPVDRSDRLDEIKASIDAGLPVLGFMKSWDVGLAYGYEGDRLPVRDFHVGAEETLLGITECRGLFIFFEQRTPVPGRTESARAGITHAVEWWSHSPERGARAGGDGAYYYGSQAYDRWIALLERAEHLTEDQQRALLHVNYWTFTSLHDARQKAALYLGSVADLFFASTQVLRDAALEYDQIGVMTGKVIDEGAIFPAFYAPGALERWTPDVRRKEIETINRVRVHDERAMGLLTRALRAAG